MRIIIVVLLIAAISSGAAAQQLSHEAKAYTDSLGKVYWNKRTPVYIRVASSPDDAGVLLTNEEQSQYTNPIYLDTEGVNYIRTRNAVDNSTMKPASPPQEVTLPIYADGTAPVSKAVYLNTPRFSNAGIEYLGRGLKVDLVGADTQSGVEKIYYSRDREGYREFTSPIDYAEVSGHSMLRFYAVDHVGNVESENEKNLVLDYAPPQTKHYGQGPQIDNSYTFGSTLGLEALDSLSGVDFIYYRLNSGDYLSYNRPIRIDALTDGFHQITYYSVDHVENKEQETTYEFYMDKSAPLISADILGDRFIVEDQIYFSGRTKLKFTAVDNRVGVKEVKYNINESEFVVYDQPFYLPNQTGVHLIKYFAVDNFGNRTNDQQGINQFEEFEHLATKVYVDLTGPNLSYTFSGEVLESRDTVFVQSDTKVHLTAHDTESGLQRISYSLEGSPVEYDYEEPLSFEQSGYHAVDFYGYDNVNNRNVSHMDVFVDNTGPEIYSRFSSEPRQGSQGSLVYSPGVRVYLSAQDEHVGVSEVYYSINGEEEKPYNSLVRPLRKEGDYEMKIIVYDLLGNRSEKELKFQIGKK